MSAGGVLPIGRWQIWLSSKGSSVPGEGVLYSVRSAGIRIQRAILHRVSGLTHIQHDQAVPIGCAGEYVRNAGASNWYNGVASRRAISASLVRISAEASPPNTGSITE
jgi:hypothetical protein